VHVVVSDEEVSPVPASQEMPSTLRRSPRKAQETWAKAHDSAVETYGEGERAHRTAFSALKHSFEKVGDHWEPKREKGPSDSRARSRRGRGGKSYGGVDVEGHTRDELLDMAREAGVRGRSRMTKDELGEALARANDRASDRALDRDRRAGRRAGRRRA
jgi:cation transport regulator ChaB